MNQKNDHPQVVINPFLIYIIMGACAVIAQKYLPLPLVSQPVARIIGVIIMLFNLLAGLPAVRGMLSAGTSLNPGRPSTTLILSGSYRFSRNPMYIGLTLLYAGLMVFFQNVWGIFLLPVVIRLITVWVIIPEEEYLEQKFGAEYLNYKSAVRRWI